MFSIVFLFLSVLSFFFLKASSFYLLLSSVIEVLFFYLNFSIQISESETSESQLLLALKIVLRTNQFSIVFNKVCTYLSTILVLRGFRSVNLKVCELYIDHKGFICVCFVLSICFATSFQHGKELFLFCSFIFTSK